MKPKTHKKPQDFQDLILRLQQYWASQGCLIMQPLDLEVGAGTFHPATFLRAIGPEPWRAVLLQVHELLPRLRLRSDGPAGHGAAPGKGKLHGSATRS